MIAMRWKFEWKIFYAIVVSMMIIPSASDRDLNTYHLSCCVKWQGRNIYKYNIIIDIEKQSKAKRQVIIDLAILVETLISAVYIEMFLDLDIQLFERERVQNCCLFFELRS